MIRLNLWSGGKRIYSSTNCTGRDERFVPVSVTDEFYKISFSCNIFYSSRSADRIVDLTVLFDTADACVLTATLCFWTRGCRYYTQYLYFEQC